MSKPLNENLRNVHIEDEEGDLRPVLDVAGERLSQLVTAVTTHGKAGSFTLKVDIKPSTAGALAIKTDITTKLPKGQPPESLLWPTPDGNLLAEDPRQQKLELRAVDTDKPRELKTVTK